MTDGDDRSRRVRPEGAIWDGRLRRGPQVAPSAPLALLPGTWHRRGTDGAADRTPDRYGYHRDELYFLASGQHLAWGYPDQPPLVPLVARLMSDIAPDSLVLLRLPSALAGGALVS